MHVLVGASDSRCQSFFKSRPQTISSIPTQILFANTHSVTDVTASQPQSINHRTQAHLRLMDDKKTICSIELRLLICLLPCFICACS